MKKFFATKPEIISAFLLWLIVFVVYLNTLSPSVGFIDSGELASVAMLLGIAHPTGYPLFTMLARLFSIIPIPVEEILRLNIFSALLTSMAATVFFFLLLELLEYEKKERRHSAIIASVTASLALAFSRTFWFQGLAIEVYSLHVLLICTVMYLFVKGVKTGGSRWWLLFAYMVGLSFTNHLTTILLAPALLYWFFAEHRFTKNAFTKIAVLTIPFLAGLSAYLYLPVRAAQQPLFNWGNPQSVERLWWHVTGKQFRVFMFTSGDAAKKQLNYFFNNLPNEYFILFLVLATAGFFILLFSDRKKFIFVSLLFVSCIAYSINYDIHDIDSYFLLAFIAMAMFIGIGAEKFLRQWPSSFAKRVVIASLVVVLALQVQANYMKMDQRQNYLVEDYTKSILLNLPQNAVVISYQWDYFVAASYYYQRVKNIRPDVTVVDKELLRRSWYFSQMENIHPEFMRRSKTETSMFLQELYKFEHELPYDYTIIEGSYTAVLKSFIKENDSLAIFVTPEIEEQYTSGYNRIPEGFLYRLKKDTAYVAVPFPDINYRKFSGNDMYAQQIKMLMVNALTRRGMYEQYYGHDSLARNYRQKASEIQSNWPPKVINY